MDVNKLLRERAEAQLEATLTKASMALDEFSDTLGISTDKLARLLSGYRTKGDRESVIKQLAERQARELFGELKKGTLSDEITS